MIRIHKEGRSLLLILLFVLAALVMATYLWWPAGLLGVGLVSTVFFLLILQFFRNPIRAIPRVEEGLVYAPADGKVVVIERTLEPEYFQEERLQLSIFMSPLNVHVNRSPVRGLVKYFKYHPGKYLVAWHPKSSTENERTTTVIAMNGGQEILLRQIAGALAKRIVNYLQTGDQVEQGGEIGFIKFGSRVDIYLPLDTHIEVAIGEAVKGNQTVLARLA